jgi:hypothetical protein
MHRSPSALHFSPGGLTDAIVASIAFLVLACTPFPLWQRLRVFPEWQRLKPGAPGQLHGLGSNRTS